MNDPVILTIIGCAALAMAYALMPVITGEAEWLKDRRSELAAAGVSAVLMAVSFTLHKPKAVEKQVIVTAPVNREQAAQIAADSWNINVNRSLANIRKVADARLHSAAADPRPAGTGTPGGGRKQGDGPDGVEYAPGSGSNRGAELPDCNAVGVVGRPEP